MLTKIPRRPRGVPQAECAPQTGQGQKSHCKRQQPQPPWSAEESYCVPRRGRPVDVLSVKDKSIDVRTILFWVFSGWITKSKYIHHVMLTEAVYVPPHPGQRKPVG